ncbi:hypothetical protein GQ42DRAFT_33686 [Ramicandelaber brevisporus]|nr:hypothetical protein GQ42DRAFT_33686 [Ramicandelaber brevisporus]
MMMTMVEMPIRFHWYYFYRQAKKKLAKSYTVNEEGRKKKSKGRKSTSANEMIERKRWRGRRDKERLAVGMRMRMRMDTSKLINCLGVIAGACRSLVGCCALHIATVRLTMGSEWELHCFLPVMYLH